MSGGARDARVLTDDQTGWSTPPHFIEATHEASLKLAERVPAPTRFYDLIYHPAETVFLRHGRSTGHPTMNGKAMIVNQAMIAFCERICAPELRARGLDTAETRRQILEIMYRAW